MSRTVKVIAFPIVAVLLCAIGLAIAPTTPARADMFPKPTLHVAFKNMGDELCYCTLLSEQHSTGPWSAYVPEYDNTDPFIKDTPEKEAVWRAFVEYEDSDGFYYLQYHQRCDESKYFEWTYYRPSVFKVLLYYTESDTFVSSGICEEYAFNSYYTVNMSDAKIDSVTHPDSVKQPTTVTAKRSYNYFSDIGKLVARVAITVGLELCVALAFGFRKKKHILAVLTVNVATQLILNIALTLIKFYEGLILLPLVCLFSEVIIFGLEAGAYCMIFAHPKFTAADQPKPPTWKIIVYTLVANFVSFAFGLCITLFAPNIAY